MRAASIKHAEYEILMAFMTSEFGQMNIDFYALCGGDPFGDEDGNYSDKVARDRFAKAVRNVREDILNMAARRIKYLPENHADYGLTLEELKEELINGR
jgi:hypothetical protein